MNKLIIFTKYPTPGKVKTRMISALGEKGAANLHKRLLDFTLNTVQLFSTRQQVDIEIEFVGCGLRKMQRWLGPAKSYAKQVGDDLGKKMNQAFIKGFEQGADKILIIGTDCPEMTVDDLICGFEKLDHADLVLGPAFDGGYYCIGLKAPTPQIFNDIAWGSDCVFDQTMAKAAQRGSIVRLLPKHHDIDRPADLDTWYTIAKTHPQFEKISVIIPTLNEAKNIQATLHPIQKIPNVEIIVVDGGSNDQTVEAARRGGS